VRLLTYLKLLDPRFTRDLCSIYDHQSPGQNPSALFNPDIVLAADCVYLEPRSAARLDLGRARPAAPERHRGPVLIQETQKGRKRFFAMLKRISPGHLWYAVLRIDQKRKKTPCDEERAH